MTASLKVTFQLLSYWRVGTGGSEAAGLDAVCAKDRHGIPRIPGKQVRGLFREAVRDYLLISTQSDAVLTHLFGSRSTPDQPMLGESAEGTLRFVDAQLAEVDLAALSSQPDLIPGLYRRKRSTALMAETGVAKPHSLRMEEVAVPVDLECQIEALPDADPLWSEHLMKASFLIRAIGSGRSRGLGRVIVTVGEQK